MTIDTKCPHCKKDVTVYIEPPAKWRLSLEKRVVTCPECQKDFKVEVEPPK